MSEESKENIRPTKNYFDIQASKDFARNFVNIGKVKRFFRLGTEIFNAVLPFVEERTPLSGAKAAMLVGKLIIDDFEVWPDDYFDDNWDSPYPEDFNKIILNALSGKPKRVLKTSDESVLIHIIDLSGVIFGYVINTKSDYIDRIYVESKKISDAKRVIKEELWRQMKNDNIVLRQSKLSTPKSYDRSSISLEIDDAFRPMPSKRAEKYATYLKKCIDADVSRSVLLYGPPGTGKSTTARTIVDTLKMKSFRIRVEDIGHIDTSVVFEAINIFEPDAIILDDFDRSDSQSHLLETLEFFQRHVKLVIATVNDKSKLDEAILRPGRFDELLQIKKMDEDIVKSMLGEEYADALPVVKDWPIAFIHEYVKRRRFMSPEEAQASTKELASRVKRLSRYDDDEEESSVDSVLKSNGKNQISSKTQRVIETSDEYYPADEVFSQLEKRFNSRLKRKSYKKSRKNSSGVRNGLTFISDIKY